MQRVMPLTPAKAAWSTYRRSTIATDLPIRRCETWDIPLDRLDRIEQFASLLVDAGFKHALDAGPVDEQAAITNYARVLAHPEERIRAWVIDIVASHGTATYLELATRFDDGSAVVTLNPGTPAIFEKPPWLKETRLPGADTPELLSTHRRVVAGHHAAPIAPWDFDPLTTAQAENTAILAYQRERGILRDGADDRGLGYTGRGAARSVFRIWKATH